MTDIETAAFGADDVDSRVDSIMGLLGQEPAPEEPTDEEAPAAEAEAAPSDDETEAAEQSDGEDGPDADPVTEEQEEQSTDDGEGDPETVIAAPESWTAEDKERFKELPRDLQAVIARREAEQKSTFNRQVNEAAQARKEAEKALADIQAERQRYARELSAVLQQLDGEQEPDWVKLSNEDPTEYVRQRAQWDARQRERARLQAEHGQAVRQWQEEQARQAEAAKAQAKERLLDLLPDWKDAKKAQSEGMAIAEYLKATGYGPDELGNLYDPRAVVIARKAMLYDKLQASKLTEKKVAPPPPKTLKPTASQDAPTTSKRVEALTRKAQRTDRADDKVDAILARLRA